MKGSIIIDINLDTYNIDIEENRAKIFSCLRNGFTVRQALIQLIISKVNF